MIRRRPVAVLFTLILAMGTAAGCSRSSSTTVPDSLLGVWTTPDPRYAGRFLELDRHAVTFGLDRSFIRGLPTNEDDAAITEAIVALGHRLKLRIVAEGVETEDQRAWLTKQGCDEIQGYLVGVPAPPEDVVRYLAKITRPFLESAA